MKRKVKVISDNEKTRDQCFQMALASARGETADVISNSLPTASAVEVKLRPQYRLH